MNQLLIRDAFINKSITSEGEMMNICYVIRAIPPDFAGGGKRAYRQAKELQSMSHNISIITFTKTTKAETLKTFVLKSPISFNFTKKTSKILKLLLIPSLFFQLMFFINKKFDAVHSVEGGTSTLTVLTLIVCKIKGIKCIVGSTLDGTDDPLTMYHKKFGKFLKAVFCFANAYVCISPLLRERHKMIGIDDKKIYLIPNSVNPNEFLPLSINEKIKLKTEFGFEKFKNIIITVGAITERKGSMGIVEAFSNMKAVNESALIMIGPTDLHDHNIEYTQRLREYIKQIELEERVFILGVKININQWMQISDVFILNSKKEGFGNVIIESFASGLPVISRRIEGISDFIITHGENGFIFEGENRNAALYMDMLLDNENLSRKIGNNARQTAINRFSHQIVLEKYIEAFSA